MCATNSGCSGLTSITIPSSVTSIGDGAFEGCNNIETLIWGSDVNPRAVNQYCQNKLKYVTLLDGVTSIGSSSFYGCSGLTSITIPSSVKSIGGNAFKYCSSLTSITIPSSVTSIGKAAFYGCFLRSMICLSTTPPELNSDGVAYDAIYNHTQLYVPENTYWDYAFGGWGVFIHIKEFATGPAAVSEKKAYMIADEQGFNYTVYEGGKLKNVEYTHSLDEKDLGSCWQIVRDGSQRYLYSPAAGQYATMQNGKLQLTTVPVNIDLSEQDGTIAINGTKCMLILNTEYDDPSAIGHIAVDEAKGNAPMYDLSGRKITHPTKGVFIQNGKKILVK